MHVCIILCEGREPIILCEGSDTFMFLFDPCEKVYCHFHSVALYII